MTNMVETLEHAASSYLCSLLTALIMIAPWNRADHYIFALWFLLSIFYFFPSPNLSRHRLFVWHTSTHGVALVQI